MLHLRCGGVILLRYGRDKTESLESFAVEGAVSFETAAI